METGNSKNRGTVAMADNPVEGCAPSQPSFDPGHDPAVAGLDSPLTQLFDKQPLYEPILKAFKT